VLRTPREHQLPEPELYGSLLHDSRSRGVICIRHVEDGLLAK
jgi:hypothetical protein